MGSERKRIFFLILFLFKCRVKLQKTSKSRTVTGTIMSCLCIRTMLFLLPLLLLLSNFISSYYFPGIHISIHFLVIYSLSSQWAGCRFREDETLENVNRSGDSEGSCSAQQHFWSSFLKITNQLENYGSF